MPKRRPQNINTDPSPPPPYRSEIAIVGGGLVGALLALLLAKENRSVLIVEKKIIHNIVLEAQTETRTLGLNYGSVKLFERVGLGEVIFKAGMPIHHIHVSDQKQSGLVHIDSKAESLPYLGYSIPFSVLLQDLQQRLFLDPRIRCVEGEVSTFEQDEASVRFKVADSPYEADILVGADGVDSCVRKKLGIASSEHDYHQTALIGPVQMTYIKENSAFERFTEEGAVALLPNQSGLMTLVWVMPSGRASLCRALPPPILCGDLQKIFGYRAGIFKSAAPLLSYPLRRVMSKMICQGRVGLLGNAAHLLHPVSGQGFNLSVRDVLSFVQGVRQRREMKKLGPDLWQDYEGFSVSQQNMMASLTHGLTKIFESKAWPLRIARNFALHGVEHVSVLKTLLNDVMIGGL